MDDTKTFWYVYIFIILLAIGGICLTYQKEQVVDEPIHYVQIQHFLTKDYTMVGGLTVPPGYHAIIATIMGFLGLMSSDSARIITTLFLTLTLIPAFYAITRSWRKTLQFFFFPLMFIYYFLIYTDLASLLFILMAVAALHYKKYNISGLFFICSMFIRQNNIIWLLYGGLFICIEQCIENKSWKIFDQKYIIDILKKTWTYIIGVILITIFIILNKGLVIGDRVSHPLGIHTTNIYYMLFMLFFMFLPSIMLRVKEMWNWGIKYSAISLLIIGGITLLALFNLSNNHWYNNQIINGSVMNTGVVHNIIMMWAVTSTTTRILFAIPIIIAVFYLIIAKLKNPLYYLIYPFAILTVITSQMVESRYYIIPFALFLTFREEGTEREEYYLLGYFILLALMMFTGILRHSLIW